MKRGLLLALAACWVLFTLGWMHRRLVGSPDASGVRRGGWPERLPLATAPRAARELAMAGDREYGAFLARTKDLLGGVPRLYVLAWDPNRNDLFQWYRAAFELFPTRVWYGPVPGPLPEARREIRLGIDADFARQFTGPGIDRVAFYHRPELARSAWFAASISPKPELVLRALPALEPRPPASPPSRVRWWLGLLALLAPGFALATASGLDGAFRDRPSARIALAWLLGAGGTAWLMQMLSLAGVRWSLSAIAGAWSPVIIAALWIGFRRGRPAAGSPDPGSPVPTPLPTVAAHADPAPARLRPLGLALLGLAGLIALVESHIPVGAWGNWDAWAIWGLKAKACWEAMGIPFGYLREPQYTFAHPDYPNGLPSVQCLLGLMAGGLDEGLLRFLTLAHFLALLALLPAALRDLGAGPWSLPLAGAIALLPKLQEFATVGYGDLPVAVWGAAGLAVLVRVHQGKAAPWTVALVGGLSTQVKDEGLLWAAGCLVALGAWTLAGRIGRTRLVVAGLVLLALVLPWKVTLHRLGIGPNDYVINPAAMLDAVPARLPLVLRGYALEMWGGGATMRGVAGQSDPQAEFLGHMIGTFNVLWFAIPVLLALGWRRLIASPHRELLLPVAVQVGGYLAVYLASNRDIPFHVVTTADRVLTQLSCVVFVIAASAAFGPAAPAPGPAPAPLHGKDWKKRKA